MTLVFFIITTFFVPTFSLLHCRDGPNCQFKLSFDQKPPTHEHLLKNCSINESTSCSVYLQVDYRNRQVYLSFQQATDHTELLHSSMDLLAMNPQAAVVHRYTMQLRTREKNHVRLYVFLQCRLTDQCTEDQLRQFWPRLLAIDERKHTLRALRAFLRSTTSNPLHCFDDRVNQTVHCWADNSTCWASPNTERRCTEHSNEFTYSYNKVYAPHRLSSEDVSYTLACDANNCNSNKTITELGALAREFAENSWALTGKMAKGKHRMQHRASHANRPIGSFCFTLLLGLFVVGRIV